jgi:RRXRR protein
VQPRNEQQLPRSTSLAPGSRAEAFNAERVTQPRRERTLKGERMSLNKHSVFVLSKDGKPLTPTTPAKARKLLAAGVAVKRWSRFGTFGIQLVADSRRETPDTALGVDNGTKFEGYSVVVGTENPRNVKLDLPDKKVIVKKLEERRALRRARRWRNCRRRPSRFDNRRRVDWLAPSQATLVGSRLKVIRECFRIYPINLVGFEDVRFNHAAKRWGANFSTVEIGKTRIKEFFSSQGAEIFEYQGHETKVIREKYGYRKTAVKSADKFTAHCSDSLALAVDVAIGEAIDPGPFLVVNDTYRCKRRRLHDTQPAKGGIRAPYSKGTVYGLRKGLLIGLPNGKTGQLCGEYKGGYRYYDAEGKRGSARRLSWVSSNFNGRFPCQLYVRPCT